MAAKRESGLLDGRSATDSTEPPTPSEPIEGSDEASEPAVLIDLGIDGLTGIEPSADVESLADQPGLHVFRARQDANERTVLVRVLHDEPTSAAGRRFQRECRVAGRLSGHAGIVPLFQSGITADENPFLITPFYRRGSVAQFLAEHGPVGWQQATFLLESVAVTLAEVHGRGIVHGAVSPSTIMLTDFLLPRVADFGSSMRMSSEEATGADPVVDVSGMAAVLWSLLTGQVVDSSSDLALDAGSAAAIAPTPIIDLVRRAMGEDPESCPPNASVFVTELRQAVGDASRLGTVAPSPQAEPAPETNSSTTIRTTERGSDTTTGPRPRGTLIAPSHRKTGDPTDTQPTDGHSTDGQSTDGQSTDVATSPSSEAPSDETLSYDAPSNDEPDSTVDRGGVDTAETPARTVAVPADAGPTAPPSDARYILLLVGCIGAVIVVMVAAAMLTVS